MRSGSIARAIESCPFVNWTAVPVIRSTCMDTPDSRFFNPRRFIQPFPSRRITPLAAKGNMAGLESEPERLSCHQVAPRGLLSGVSRLHGRNPVENRKSLSQKQATISTLTTGLGCEHAQTIWHGSG